jgi:hypothetical protein
MYANAWQNATWAYGRTRDVILFRGTCGNLSFILQVVLKKSGERSAASREQPIGLVSGTRHRAPEQLMSSFSDLSHLSLFFFILWFASTVSSVLWLGIVGELVTGIVFVAILDFVPFTDAVTLFGSLGIAMLIVDGMFRGGMQSLTWQVDFTLIKIFCIASGCAPL